MCRLTVQIPKHHTSFDNTIPVYIQHPRPSDMWREHMTHCSHHHKFTGVCAPAKSSAYLQAQDVLLCSAVNVFVNYERQFLKKKTFSPFLCFHGPALAALCLCVSSFSVSHTQPLSLLLLLLPCFLLLFLHRSLCLSFPLSAVLYPHLTIFLKFCISVLPSSSLFFLSLCLPLSVSVSLSHSLSLPLPLYLSLSLSVSLPVSVSPSLFFLFFSPSLSLFAYCSVQY